MPSFEALRQILSRIDGRGYKAYKDLEGCFVQGPFTLAIDHVQGDPFAAPSKIRLRVSQNVANLPEDLFSNPIRRIALQDFLGRSVHRNIQKMAQGRRGMGKSGLVAIDVGGQEVLERTSMVICQDWVETRLAVGLPANGRTILGRQAEAMLCEEIPKIMEQALFWRNVSDPEARQFVLCVENQESIRDQLDGLELVAFVADGSILPRMSGASDQPLLKGHVQQFKSPASLQVTVPLLNPIERDGKSVHAISGMGIPKGVTLIVGGGYHGKSTLLRALERGVYPHIPGDGREYVVTNPHAVKVRAEDGRCIENVDISGFITDLPFGQPTSCFSTDNASGSTSQAATIVEAIEVGAQVLLLDEDTSATNFMVRDARMQALVKKDDEPITPFVDRVRELYQKQGVSTILVMGGCGDYFEVSDTVIMMRNYLPADVSKDAHRLAETMTTKRCAEVASDFPMPCPRVPLPESFDASRGRRDVKIDAKSEDLILYGQETIDLRGLEQLIHISQTRAVGHAIFMASKKFMDGRSSLKTFIEAVVRLIEEKGLDVLDPFFRPGIHPGNFARPRAYEIAAAINRLRTVRMKQ